MFDRLLQFLNLSDEQRKQFDELKNSFEKEDQEINAQIKDLMKKKKDSWNSKKETFENILTDEQKDRMNSLFDLFSPFTGNKKAKGFWGSSC